MSLRTQAVIRVFQFVVARSAATKQSPRKKDEKNLKSAKSLGSVKVQPKALFLSDYRTQPIRCKHNLPVFRRRLEPELKHGLAVIIRLL